jgi:hypothetical protein
MQDRGSPPLATMPAAAAAHKQRDRRCEDEWARGGDDEDGQRAYRIPAPEPRRLAAIIVTGRKMAA